MLPGEAGRIAATDLSAEAFKTPGKWVALIAISK